MSIYINFDVFRVPFVWSAKYHIFGQELLILITLHTLLEIKHPGDTISGDLYYLLSPDESQKKLSDYGLVLHISTFYFNRNWSWS